MAMDAVRRSLLIATLLVPFAASAQTAPAKAEAPVQPGLLALAQPRIADLRAAGVKQIIGRTTGRSNVQVLTNWGASYLRWPKDVKPIAFELYVNSDGTNAAFASDFSDATKAQYAAALDALIPAAIKAAANARAAANRPKA
jgi:hypothetical protein